MNAPASIGTQCLHSSAVTPTRAASRIEDFSLPRRLSVCIAAVAANLVLVMAVPMTIAWLATPSSPTVVVAALPPGLQVTVFLAGCGLLCAADMSRTIRGEVPEQLPAFSVYHHLSRTTGILLLATQWSAILESMLSGSSISIPCVVAGAPLVISGCVIRFLAIRQLGPAFISSAESNSPRRQLTVGGIYSIVRHPSELGLLMAILGLLVSVQAWTTVLVALPVSLLLSCLRIRLEEQSLLQTHESDYRQYRSTVCCLLPWGVFRWPMEARRSRIVQSP